MITVIATGTFDILHKGHINFLKQAKELGDHLTVIVARDETVMKVKKRSPMHTEKQRLSDVLLVPSVDIAVLGNLGDKYAIIQELDPDIIALGYDQTHFIDSLQNELRTRNLKAKIVRLNSFKAHNYKSSTLKQVLPTNYKQDLND